MLLVLLALLGVTVAAAPLVSRVLHRNAGWVLALPLLAAAVMGATSYTRGAVHTESVDWMPSLGVSFGVRLDGLSLVFLMLVLVIGAGVLAYSTRYLHHKDTAFYFYICGFALAMAMLVTTDSLMVFYVAWELTTLCSYFLIANSGEKGHQPAIRTLLVTVLGGLFLLMAVIIMAITTGTMQLSEVISSPVWDDHAGVKTGVAVLVALAAFTKSAQFPFQAWLPDSMVAIAPVSAYLHAAAMVKAGIYLILRFSPLFSDIQAWHVMLVLSGGFTALFGAMTAVTRDDLKELLAYSTMSQLGLLVTIVGVGTPEALTAAIVHTVAHACFKAALFMSVGIIEHETGTRSYRELRHTRVVKMPVTKTAIVVAGASMAGLPLLFGFVSKEGLITAVVESGMNRSLITLVAGVIVGTSIFTFAYSMRYIIGAFGATKHSRAEEVAESRLRHEEPAQLHRIGEASPAFWMVPALLGIVTLVLGLVPGLLNEPVTDASLAATGGFEQDIHLAVWHGVNIPLGLSAIIIAAGCVLVHFNRELARALTNFGAPVKGLDVVEMLRNGVIEYGGKYFTRPTGTTSMRRHLAMPLVGLLVIAIIGIFTLTDIPSVRGENSRAVDWIFVLIISIGVLASVMARSRLTVVVVVSIAGFGVTLWFFALGAADVATTQLLVEILSVCVLVLVLHRLPDRFTPDKRGQHFWSIALAVAMGAATTLAVWGLTGRRGKSEAARYFLDLGPEQTGGDNIVNTIIVDYRAFDTFGELTVLGMAGISIAVLLRHNRLLPLRDTLLDKRSPLFGPGPNAVFVRTTTKLVGPIIVLLSVVLFVRGHHEPGGGFVAALVGSAGIALLYLGAKDNASAPIRWPYFTLIGLGVTVAALTGFIGFFDGAFLKALHAEIFGMEQTSSMIFDLGVYLAVMGVLVGAFNMLGMPREGDKERHVLLDLEQERRLERFDHAVGRERNFGEDGLEVHTPTMAATPVNGEKERGEK
ncbi:DUF4040 family protein [Corynebacterium massiliense]|uniref:Na(+)/H(+) antiporter subunit A n=1 Tax=Corynebacterium massiliense DSM 45435 TaxID=1121364 RepID=A0ABY7UA02_9CORY|nr:DUF4040 family protein [Corynebacterium massiliense]WCZ32789.1 Na(+)/H(+) antiporter subunit A [Corynebacterium massiliense DSM 45435]